MAKSDPAANALAKLNALKGMGSGSVIAGELGKFLEHKANVVVAKAAELVRAGEITSLQPEMEAAFARFMKSPTSTDKGCAAKEAIATTLYELGCDAEGTFLAGVRHFQKEGSYGPPVDTAVDLRGVCALGLVRMAYRDVMVELADLLADESHRARIMAARAIAYAGRDEGALLLRLKIRTGDREPDVTAECLIALGGLWRLRALSFVAGFLDDRDSTLAEAAAMALGEMRHESALALLQEQWRRNDFGQIRAGLALPIALSRLPASVGLLVGALATEPEPVAGAAIEAMRIYRHDAAVSERIRAAALARRLAKLDALVAKYFGD